MAFIVRLPATQTIREAEATVQILRDALDSSDDILLDCEEIEETDLTFLQLVIAARKSATARGKSFGLTTTARGTLLAALDCAGIRPEGDQAFWFEGGHG
jgi:phospholipid transport system transporter-binding protein